jgi:hypothetical protein
VYGVGQNKPDIRGLKDLNNLADFELRANTATRSGQGSPLLFNTG